MKLASVSSLALAAAIFTVPATAQLVQQESLTNWTHLGGAPNWTDNVSNTGSVHGIVDQLNSIATLQYNGTSNVLPAGTYVAAVRLMKFQDQTGVADLEFLAVGGGGAPSVVLPAASQATDTWVRTPYLVFSLPSAQPVTFVLQNVDPNITKQNYYFDEVTVGRIDRGPTVYYESMTRWGHAWGGDPRYYAGEVVDADSAAGIAEELLSVWWLEFLPKQVTLPPGLYTANVRLKKTVGAAGSTDVDLEVRLPAGNARVTLLAADQTPDQYVYTPDLVFTVNAGETPSFWFGNTSGTLKRGYYFDALIVRSGAYTPYGSACPSSLGDLEMTATTPVIGQTFTATVQNVPATGGVYAFGGQRSNVDLTAIGMPGCWLLSTYDALVPLIPTAGGVAEATLMVPVNASLAGASFFNQAVVFDPGINAIGIATSNGGQGEISP